VYNLFILENMQRFNRSGICGGNTRVSVQGNEEKYGTFYLEPYTFLLWLPRISKNERSRKILPVCIL
jgi:hypothetical protein